MRRFLGLLFWAICAIPVYASSLDSVRISLLTCAPGSEIYSLFGHTALRYENPAKGEDWVFNYGLFSFDTPNFVYRFVKGETDYQLGVIPYRYFEGEYAMRGSSVYQQELNLTYLFIAHDLSVVKFISDKIGVMYLGSMVELVDISMAVILHFKPSLLAWQY